MYPPTDRVNHLDLADRRAEFVAVVERVAPRAGQMVETIGLYLLLSAFWGVVLYFAIINAF